MSEGEDALVVAEGDAAPAAEVVEAPVPVIVTLDILSLTKDAQTMNGMRDGNHEKYRHFCARKLVRLRNGLGIKTQKGKGKTPKRYPVAEDVKDSRALQLVLFDAERAWAYAMELKAGISTEPRKRHHMIARLRKATKHVDRLETLSKSVTCDARTNLEISAYRTWIYGVLAFEQGLWQEALDKFATARTVYERMAQVGNPAQRALCHARVEEIEPTLRFCAYNLEAGSGRALPTDLVQLVQLRSQMSAAGLTSLATKFEELMLSAAPAGSEGGPRTIKFGSKDIAIQNVKVREFLQQAHQMHEAVNASEDKKERSAMFDRLLMLLSDAARAAKEDIKLNEEAQAKAKSEKGKDTTAELTSLHSAILFERYARSVERTQLLADMSTSTADAAILYNTIAQSWAEAKALPLVDQEPTLVARADAAGALARAQRCLQLATGFETSAKHAEAAALLERAGQVATLAVATATESDDTVSALMAQLKAVAESASSRVHQSRASAILGSSGLPSTRKRAEGESGPLVEFEEFELAGSPMAPIVKTSQPAFNVDQPNVISMSAKFVPMPVKPVFFDLAERYIDYPTITTRKEAKPAAPQASEEQQAEQRGGLTGYFSSWLGGGKK